MAYVLCRRRARQKISRRLMSSRSSLSTIRICRVPPTTGYLEPFNLGSYGFRAGRVYSVPHSVADVLIAWNYAERVPDPRESPPDKETP